MMNKLINIIHNAMDGAVYEEDVKLRFSYIMRKSVFDYYRIPYEMYEKRIGFGYRIDALYGNVVVEYEKPHVLELATGSSASIAQVQKYIMTMAMTESNYTKYIGFCFDGFNMCAINYDDVGKVWIVQKGALDQDKLELFIDEVILSINI